MQVKGEHDMSKICPHCGYANEDEHYFCRSCGEALDSDVRLMMDYNKMKKSGSQPAQHQAKDDADDDDISFHIPREKSSVVPLIVLAVLLAACIAGVAAYLLLA